MAEQHHACIAGVAPRTCAQCGAPFKPARRSAKQIRAGHVQRFCSNTCRGLAGRKPEEPKAAKACDICDGAFFGAGLRCGEACRDEARRRWIAVQSRRNDTADRSERPCAECSRLFRPVYGTKLRRFCSSECGHRNVHRIRRKVERAQRYGAPTINPVDPIRVFTDAGWSCAECGVPTPRSLLGEAAPNSPEMDHIIPLSEGGEHTYRNVQCLCRTCNRTKAYAERSAA